MAEQFEVSAELRNTTETGSAAARRLRRAGRVPGVIYGAGKPAAHIVMNHDDMRHKLAVESFHSAIIAVKTGRHTDSAVLRGVQMHPHRSQILHIDFQRVRASEAIHMKVPLHVIGGDTAPGIKVDGGILSHLMTEIDVTCLPRDLPEYLEIDVSQLGLNESLHLSDLKAPPGVELTGLAHGGEDLSIVAIVPPAKEIEEPVEGAEAEAVEGEEPAEPAAAGEAAEGGGETGRGEG